MIKSKIVAQVWNMYGDYLTSTFNELTKFEFVNIIICFVSYFYVFWYLCLYEVTYLVLYHFSMFLSWISSWGGCRLIHTF